MDGTSEARHSRAAVKPQASAINGSISQQSLRMQRREDETWPRAR